MKAISLWQPWASLMALGLKKIETRSWGTSYRGPLAIHASKRLVIPPDPEFKQAIIDLGLAYYEWPLGQVVGICDLYDCIQIGGERDRRGFADSIIGYERIFGDYSLGRFIWVTKNMEKLAEPIKCVGRQGLFEWHCGDQFRARWT